MGKCGNDHETWKKYREFAENGHMERLPERFEGQVNFRTGGFATMVQMFQALTQAWDFTKRFRVVIDYDPEQPKIATHYYVRENALDGSKGEK